MCQKWRSHGQRSDTFVLPVTANPKQTPPITNPKSGDKVQDIDAPKVDLTEGSTWDSTL